CLGIALLSLALANPVVTFGESEDFLSSLPSANVFILDDSYSMATRAGETSRFQNAVKTLS
ncbi:MAG: hypothetical protein GWM98_09395, partial [Nitrospinaceae bacterium]|nr:hypothetical protein [Nitrospinaceae bacterium]NIR54669.1 hypothetical protein [Nitrospinaceae bacterium]NIS85086.1 hypothetical protein [Nitrospinaceae bacterium]NIT81903.1 hypothetical protein [Nitrospinaceae bacterium]NIU44167.1 hypothetical protein [Nitrospinaceae bacterium]